MNRSGYTEGPAALSPLETLPTQGTPFQQFVAQAEYASENPLNPELAANTMDEFRSNRSSLRKDEWLELDQRLIDVAQRQFRAVDDLRNAGLTISTDLGTLIYEWEKHDIFGPAHIDMGAEARGRDEESTFDIDGVPLPIAHKSFHINERMLMASRRRGQALDATNQAKATRSVIDSLEHMIFRGWENPVRGYQVYGYMTHPAAQGNEVTGTDWTDTTTDWQDVRTDVLETIETAEDNHHRGPYWLYLAKPQWQALRRIDTGTDQERSVFERLNDEFGDLIDMRMAEYLEPGEGVLVHPVEDVVELAIASDFQNVEWTSHSDFTVHMKVMASMTPVVKEDDEGQCGIVPMTGLSG